VKKEGTRKAMLIEDAMTTARLLRLQRRRGRGGRRVKGNYA
jgi:hypothetical protein